MHSPRVSSATSSDWRVDWPARALVIMCVLNLNGVFSMMFDVGQVVSLGMLVAAVVLVVGTGRYAWSRPFSLLVAAITTYLIFGLLFYDHLVSVEPASKYIQTYFNTILIVWAIAGYVASLEAGTRLARFLTFIRNIFLVSAASVWASPILYEYYVNLPFSAQQRMGGFFGNPNEAAMVSVLAVALTLALPFKSRIIQLGALGMASIAVFMTFSKTGMSCLVVILAWHLVRSAKGLGLALLPLGAVIAIAIIQEPTSILEAIAENPMLELDQSQKGRILAIGQILGGQLDQQTTTGRTYLWQIVIGRAWDNFPWGGGLGSAHHVVGGLLERNVWQGAHNTFLMMWAEAGVLPAFLLMAAVLAALVSSIYYSRGQIELTSLAILCVDMMATHTALGTRYHNVVLATILGLIAGVRKKKSKNSHAVGSLPIRRESVISGNENISYIIY